MFWGIFCESNLYKNIWSNKDKAIDNYRQGYMRGGIDKQYENQI